MAKLALGLPGVTIAVVLAGYGVGACSVTGSEPGLAAGNPPGPVGGATSTGLGNPVGANGLPSETAGGSGGTPSAGSQTVACTEGVDCNCPTLNVAVIGKPGKWGAPGGDSDTAFQEWLNSSSAGTAKADVFARKPTLTPEFLAAYNVIILASLSDDSNGGPFWTFDSAEVAAFQDWIESQAGGVIALTGYSSDPRETTPTNHLTAFSEVAFSTESVDVVAPCLDWAVCGCAGSQTLSDWNKTDAAVANLSHSITWVGFEKGRSITAPPDALVAATVLYNNVVTNVLVGKFAGKGRVLMYGDEWITYTSQWTGAGVIASNCTEGKYPQDSYQTAQFWYNMIKWVQPNATCFRIVNDENPVTIW